MTTNGQVPRFCGELAHLWSDTDAAMNVDMMQHHAQHAFNIQRGGIHYQGILGRTQGGHSPVAVQSVTLADLLGQGGQFRVFAPVGQIAQTARRPERT